MRTTQGIGTPVLLALAFAACGCTTVTGFAPAAATRAPSSGAVAALAARARTDSALYLARENRLQRCRFETPGRAERMLVLPGTDAQIMACMARLEARQRSAGS